MTRRREISDPFYQGGIAALEAFEIELIQRRADVEADPEPTVDVVLELIRRILTELEDRAPRAPARRR